MRISMMMVMISLATGCAKKAAPTAASDTPEGACPADYTVVECCNFEANTIVTCCCYQDDCDQLKFARTEHGGCTALPE